MESRAYGPPSHYYIPTKVLSIPISSPVAKIPATGPPMPQQQDPDQDQNFNNLAAQQLQSELNAYIADLPPQRHLSSLDQASKPLQPPLTQKCACVRPTQPPPPHRNDGTAVNYASTPNLGGDGGGGGGGGGRGGGGKIQEPSFSPKPHNDNATRINPTTKPHLAALASTLQTQGLNPARALLIASWELDTCTHPQPLRTPDPDPNTHASKTEFDFHADYVAFDESDREAGNDEEDVEREVFARLPRRLRYGDKDVGRVVGRGR